jgi:ligand-binding SRPBCC domain-containing protein
MNWVTEITHVVEGKLFVDEQRFGPYRFWHHRHILSQLDKGTEMKDIVVYKLPFGLLGRVINSLSVRKRLHRIFNFRYRILEEEFNR